MDGSKRPEVKKLDWPEMKTYRVEATMAGAKIGGVVGAAVMVVAFFLFMFMLDQGVGGGGFSYHMVLFFGGIGFVVGTLVGVFVGVAIDRLRG